METGVTRVGARSAGLGGSDRGLAARSRRDHKSRGKSLGSRGRGCGTSVALVMDIAGAHDDHRLQQTRNRRQQTSPGATNMSDTMTPQVDETPKVVAVEGELSDAALEGVAGGFLDNLNAKCEISGGLNLLSSNVAIE